MKLKYLWFKKKPEPRRFDIPEDGIEELLCAWDDYFFNSRTELNKHKLYKVRRKIIPEADGIAVTMEWDKGNPYLKEYID